VLAKIQVLLFVAPCVLAMKIQSLRILTKLYECVRRNNPEV